MKERWYEFKLNSEDEIVASYACPQPEQEGHGRIEQLAGRRFKSTSFSWASMGQKRLSKACCRITRRTAGCI